MNCEHRFIFLRQDKRNIGYDRNPTYLIEDIYFCEKCLKYQRVGIEKRTPKSDSYTEEYIERLV